MIARSRPVAAPVAAMLALGAVAGCAVAGCSASRSTAATAGPPAKGSSPAVRCGSGHTSAGVPVEIEVERGPVACRVALRVERDYARAFAAGKVRGNGGGAPVSIQGWVCQGFNTPEVLATGRASACRKGHAEILAVLPGPSPSAGSF